MADCNARRAAAEIHPFSNNTDRINPPVGKIIFRNPRTSSARVLPRRHNWKQRRWLEACQLATSYLGSEESRVCRKRISQVLFENVIPAQLRVVVLEVGNECIAVFVILHN